jgi:threonine aldolase
MTRAKRIRKLFGGGMRQAGWAAAGALYAFDNNIDRLAEDHRNAQVIAQAVADTPGLRLDPPDVQTNLVWFEIDPELGSAKDVQAALRQHGVLVNSTAAQVCRACTHLDVSAAQVERASETIRKALRQPVAIT